jgi:hypothetical protein
MMTAFEDSLVAGLSQLFLEKALGSFLGRSGDLSPAQVSCYQWAKTELFSYTALCGALSVQNSIA